MFTCVGVNRNTENTRTCTSSFLYKNRLITFDMQLTTFHKLRMKARNLQRFLLSNNEDPSSQPSGCQLQQIYITYTYASVKFKVLISLCINACRAVCGSEYTRTNFESYFKIMNFVWLIVWLITPEKNSALLCPDVFNDRGTDV